MHDPKDHAYFQDEKETFKKIFQQQDQPNYGVLYN